jgi:hypothetical protein
MIAQDRAAKGCGEADHARILVREYQNHGLPAHGLLYNEPPAGIASRFLNARIAERDTEISPLS